MYKQYLTGHWKVGGMAELCNGIAKGDIIVAVAAVVDVVVVVSHSKQRQRDRPNDDGRKPTCEERVSAPVRHERARSAAAWAYYIRKV